MDPDCQALVIDIGGGMTTCGFTGDDAPRAVYPTIVGRPKRPGIMVGMDAKDCFVGDEAQAKRGILNLSRPVQYRQVVETDWNDLEKIYHHTFYNELCVTPEEHPFLLSESPTNPRSHREKITSMFFETFNCVGLYLAVQQALALYASGRVTGVCLDSGYDITHVVPIYESHDMNHFAKELRLGGCDITKRLVQLLDERGYDMSTTAEREIVRDIKEKLAYVSLDFEEEAIRVDAIGADDCSHEYELPDGSRMTIAEERFRAPEVLFQPSLCELESPGIHTLVADTIASVDMDLLMWGNIVLCGGSTMFEGFEERLTKDLKVQLDPAVRIKVNAPSERKYSVWIGGSILSSLNSFSCSWILKEEYDDAGASIVQRKCL